MSCEHQLLCDVTLDVTLDDQLRCDVTLDQGSPDMVLEGRCPAEFISNPNQTHLKQLINVLLGILETSREVCWGKLELNSAGHRSSRIKFGDPCSRRSAERWRDSWRSTVTWLDSWRSTVTWLDSWRSTVTWLDSWRSTVTWLDSWWSTVILLDSWQSTVTWLDWGMAAVTWRGVVVAIILWVGSGASPISVTDAVSRSSSATPTVNKEPAKRSL